MHIELNLLIDQPEDKLVVLNKLNIKIEQTHPKWNLLFKLQEDDLQTFKSIN